MPAVKRVRPLALAGAVTAIAVACAAPAAQAAPGGRSGPAYSAPSGAWNQFTSELSSAGGVATGQGVTIAVLADGVDTSAQGLPHKVTVGPRYFSHESAPVEHTDGTMAAAVILGTSGTLQGAAPGAKLLDLRVIPDDSRDRKSMASHPDAAEGKVLAKAITYAADHGASVIETVAWVDANNVPKPLATAVVGAVAKGAVIVTPATSGMGADDEYPDSAPGVIGAASVMLPGGQDPSQGGASPGSANNSSKDNSVLIAGPGDWVQAFSDGWGPYGPGASEPYVAATAALIKQRYPHLAPGLVERAIAMSAQDKPSGGYSTQVGFGVLDPYDAVLDAATLAKVTPAAAPGKGVTAAGAHFGSGPLPGPVYALPSALWQIILSCAGIVVGAALLAFAVLLVRRRRKASRVQGQDQGGDQGGDEGRERDQDQRQDAGPGPAGGEPLPPAAAPA